MSMRHLCGYSIDDPVKELGGHKDNCEVRWMCSQNNIFDRKIVDYINNSKEEYPDSMLENCDSWEVFYHLSSMRKSILNWYEFYPQANVLEIGAGFGAVTGVLCDNCRHVTAVEKDPVRASAISRRFKRRNNLEIIVADINDFQCPDKYDYIVMIGAFEKVCCRGGKEKCDEVLNKFCGWLNPGGKLLFTANNRAGIKNLCGYMVEADMDSFEGVNSESYFYIDELRKLVEKIKVQKYKIFYPLPDYKLTQAVYTDEFPPKGNIGDRVIPYYPYNRKRYIDDVKLSEKLIENDMFSFFSDTFLLECSVDEQVSDIIFAAVSTDRGEEHGFATIIKQNEVIKKTLSSYGTAALLDAYHNCQNLKERGISIVPQRWQNKEIVMPRIREQSAMNQLMLWAEENQIDEIYQLFEKIWFSIIQSSESIDASENELLSRKEEVDWGPILRSAYIDMVPMNCFYIDDQLFYFDQEFRKENYPAKYVMFRAIRYAYLSVGKLESLIPLDVMKERFKISTEMWKFFLQLEDEFIEENRRHKENRFFYKMVENKNRLLSVKEKNKKENKYEGTKTIYTTGTGFDSLEGDEEHDWHWATENRAEILLDNKGNERKCYLKFSLFPPPGQKERNVKIYFDDQMVARELAPAKCEIKVTLQENCTHKLIFCSLGEKTTVEGDERKFSLMLQDFKICEEHEGYLKSTQLVAVQERHLELLEEFMKICKKHGLTYYLVFGSLLGAVRNHGIVPWDDDVDIAMPRKDYELFLMAAKQELKEMYFIQTPENDLQCFYGGYAKLRSERDCAIEEINLGHNCHQGIWIDIMPMDNVDKDTKRRKKQIKKIQFYQEIIFAKTYGELKQGVRGIEPNRWKRLRIFGSFFSQKYLRRKLSEAIIQANEFPADEVAFYAQYTGKKGPIFLKKSWLEKGLSVQFETLMVNIPQEWENCLKVMEGDEYQELPAPEERKMHHVAFYDLENSYKEYQKRFNINKHMLKQRELIIFGEGETLDEFLMLYAEQVNIALLLNNRNRQAGTIYQGYMVEKTEILNEINRANYNYVICNSIFQDAEKLLQQYGIEDYYIFLGTRKLKDVINLD